ncbi:hypothetical protein T484DRAFT_1777578 [Baffinella frigidus]|nr:hypothetical protein T484DRAFT_1777578 [Cryptophyta sp. CCMP2293]
MGREAGLGGAWEALILHLAFLLRDRMSDVPSAGAALLPPLFELASSGGAPGSTAPELPVIMSLELPAILSLELLFELASGGGAPGSTASGEIQA